MGWIIAGAVVIVLLLLILSPVTVYFDYSKDILLTVRYLCFTLFRIPAVKKKPAGKREKKPREKKKDREDKEEKKEKPSLSEIMNLIKCVMNSLGKPLRKILKRTAFSHFTLKVVCGGEDAAKAALNYGRVNIAVGSALGMLDSFFTLKKVDDIDVSVDFYSETTTAECYVEVRLSPAAALAFVFTMLGRFLKNYVSDKDLQVALKKLV